MSGVEITETTIGNVLTRTTGYLTTVSSHSLQPYRGCSYGNSLCGVGCYVQHNRYVTAGRPWGGFLEVRMNAAESYLQNCEREARWARRRSFRRDTVDGVASAGDLGGSAERPGRFSVFCSSSTDPCVPQEHRYGITRSVLRAMCERPPDELILQTHSHTVSRLLPEVVRLAPRCDLRLHMSIETDREEIPGLPPSASSVSRRLEACQEFRRAGIRTVATVSPLLPVENPRRFFETLADCTDAVVIDHFIGGDGTRTGSRTSRTALPEAMRTLHPGSESLDYRDAMVELARSILPGRVGVSIAGFAGHFD